MDGIDFVIPMTERDEIDGFCSLQSFIMSVTEVNVEASAQVLLNSEWILHRKEVSQIARTLVLTAKYRPTVFESLITLFKILVDNINPTNALNYLKDDVSKTIFRSMYFGKPFPGECSNFAFLFHAMNSGIYTPDEITAKIRRFHYNNPKFYRTSAWLFAWFAPEIYHSDQHFYDIMKKHIMPQYKEIERYAHAIKKFIERYDEYSSNDFALLRSARLQSQHKVTLLSIIKRDNVQGLITHFSFPANHIDSRLEPSLYCPNPYIQYRPTYNMVAAFYGSYNAFKYFSMNQLINEYLDNKLSSLAEFAIAGGNMSIIRMCEDLRCSFSSTAHVAAQYHRTEILKFLHKNYKIDLNQVDNMGYNVLHRAAEGNCISAIEYCLKNGCDINTVSSDGNSVLSIAVKNGNIDTVRYIVGLKNVNLELGSEFGNGPIHLAARFGDLSILKLLISKGVDINSKDSEGATALCYAAEGNQIKIVKFLLAQPNIEANIDNEGGTPFCRAASTGNPNLVKLMMNHPKVDITHVYGFNYNALQCAMKQRKKNVLQMLLKDGRINVNSATTKGETPLHIAAKFGRSYASRLLLKEFDIDVNATTRDGMTPLMYAVKNHRERTVLHLINDKRVDVNVATQTGETAVTISIQNPTASCLDILLNRQDLNVNTKHYMKMTPLHIAVNSNKVDCVNLLLHRSNIDVDAKAANGMTAFVMAVLQKKPDIIKEFVIDGRINLDEIHDIDLGTGQNVKASLRKIIKAVNIPGIDNFFSYFDNKCNSSQ